MADLEMEPLEEDGDYESMKIESSSALYRLPWSHRIANASPGAKLALVAVVALVAFVFGHSLSGAAVSTVCPGGGTNIPPPPHPHAPSRPVDADALAAAVVAAKAKISQLAKYYGPTAHYQLNRALEWGFNEKGEPESLSNFQRTVDVFARSIVWDDAFVMGFIGSSVMAGHDNCYYDSFPEQMRRTLADTFAALEKELVIRNAGEGGDCGDSYENQIFCVSHNIGTDVDVVHYSWTYFEHGPEVPIFHEHIVRWSATMSKRPPIMFFNTGGYNAATPQRIPDKQDQFKYTATGGQGHPELSQRYESVGINGFSLERVLAFNQKYLGKVWGQPGDGVHQTTRYGELEKSEERRKSLGVVFRNWHPGPLGFQMTADAFSYFYLKALVEAIAQVTASDAPSLEWPRVVVTNNKDLPPRIEREHESELNIALNSLDEPPGCLNLEQPTFGKHAVYVGDPTDQNNPYVGKLNLDVWDKFEAGPNIKMVPKTELDLKPGEPGCVPLDSCAYLRSKSASDGWQTFMLPRMNLGFIAVCGYGKLASAQLTDRIEVQLNGVPMPSEHFVHDYPSRKCTTLQNKWMFALDDAGGHLFLGFRVKSDGDFFTISHVIAI